MRATVRFNFQVPMLMLPLCRVLFKIQQMQAVMKTYKDEIHRLKELMTTDPDMKSLDDDEEEEVKSDSTEGGRGGPPPHIEALRKKKDIAEEALTVANAKSRRAEQDFFHTDQSISATKDGNADAANVDKLRGEMTRLIV